MAMNDVCFQCGGPVRHRSFGLTPPRCPECGLTRLRTWLVFAGVLSALGLSVSLGIFAFWCVCTVAAGLGTPVGDAFLMGFVAALVALVTILPLLLLLLGRIEPSVAVHREWLVGKSWRENEPTMQGRIFFRMVATSLLCVLGIVTIDVASWIARILACAMLLTWGWFFGRWYARNYMDFVRRQRASLAESDT